MASQARPARLNRRHNLGQNLGQNRGKRLRSSNFSTASLTTRGVCSGVPGDPRLPPLARGEPRFHIFLLLFATFKHLNANTQTICPGGDGGVRSCYRLLHTSQP